MDPRTPQGDGGLFANPNRGYPILGDPGQIAAPNATTGADLVMPDVLSFSVRVMIAGNNDFMDLSDPRFQAFSSDNPQFYSATSTPPRLTSPAVFDTWSAVKDDAYDYTAWAVKTTATTKATATTIPIWHNAAGTAIRIIALQITIRIWDLKSEQTRQITIIQDM
jgi:hypothetical protein